MSLVSGSQVSGAPMKKKRGRKSKAERANEAAAEAAMRDATPSLVGGRAATEVSATSGNHNRKGDEVDGAGEGEEFELPENMASKAAHRSKEQIKEEERLRALVSRHMDRRQFVRYEVWHGATLRMADVKRVSFYPPCVQILPTRCFEKHTNCDKTTAHKQRDITILPG